MKAPVKRWLLLTQYYAPEIGAPQIRLGCLVRELRRHGIEVDVLTAMPNYPTGEIFEDYRGKVHLSEKIDGVSVTRVWIYAASGRSALVRLMNYLSFTLTAAPMALLGPRYEAVFIEGQPLSLGIIGLLTRWLRGMPYIFNVPDLQVDVARQLGFIRRQSFLSMALWLEHFIMQRSWKVSTVTRRFVEVLHERGVPRRKLTYLPNGADVRFLAPREPSANLVERWQIQDKKVFLYVGTHAFYHGLDTIVHAARALAREDDIIFLMIGNGPERTRIVAEARELQLSNLIFGQSPYSEMPDLYSIAWASVATLRDMPAAHDMRLSKIFPSLSCEVPVIYSGRGEAAEFVQRHGCGLAVAPENPEELAQAVRRLASDPAGRRQMGEAGRAVVTASYSWESIVENWLNQIA